MPKAKILCDHMYIDKQCYLQGDVVELPQATIDFANTHGARLEVIKPARKKAKKDED